MRARPPLSSRIAPFGTSVFAEMSRLAAERGAVNLGQGFPDFPGPAFVKEAARRAIADDRNQYARTAGEPALVRAVADKVRRRYGLDVDPLEEVTVYSGCTEAILVAVLALCEPGDEVVLFEPFYDSYPACVALAGATPRFVRMEGAPARWDPAALAAAFSPRTRAVLLNTPHNPSGRVLGRAELGEVAALARTHDAYVIADEVYEHLVFDGEHVPIATLPGMYDRTVTLSSTGKTFSLTGWKIGYSVAARPVTAALRAVHQFVTFATATPLQHAMAEALASPAAYYAELERDYRARRERLCALLSAAGLAVVPPEGTYFACADIRPLGWDDDVAFCRHLVEDIGVAAIPMSAFYAAPPVRHLVRFAFCKRDQTLEEAAARLRRLRPR